MYCILKPRAMNPDSEIPRPSRIKGRNLSSEGPVPAPCVLISLEHALLPSCRCPIAEVSDQSVGHEAEHGFP